MPDVFLRLLNGRRRYRVAWHGYRYIMACCILIYKPSEIVQDERYGTYNTGENFRQALGGASSLGFTAVETILEFEQWLADGIRK